LAVAVVRDNTVIFLKGVGVRKVGSAEPVTPDTIFSVGSVTKAFTATLLGTLADDSKLAWDDPVRRHLPWFRLADPLADREVTLRDLLCHRTGLVRHELLWYRAPWSIEESVRRLAYLEPAHSFRSTYDYNNLAYQAAGLAAAAAGKAPWHVLVQRRIFEPIGMHGVFTSSQAQQSPDHATPHRRSKDGPQAIAWYNDDNQIRASGSIKTSARQLSKWLLLQLADGLWEGKRVVSSAALAETRRPQIVAPLAPELAQLAGTTQSSYGLGWHIRDHRGLELLEHGGATDGFRARILLVPRKGLGLVLLANGEEAAMMEAVGYTLLDRLLPLPEKDWMGYYRGQRREPEPTPLPARQPDTRPSHPLEDYIGVYHEPAYGTLKVAVKDGRLHLAWSSFQAALEHYHYDTFLPQGSERLERELLVFALNGDGEVSGVRFLGRTFKRTTNRER
jgi:CubicO group peptidase (beta-lactamase class C family)